MQEAERREAALLMTMCLIQGCLVGGMYFLTDRGWTPSFIVGAAGFVALAAVGVFGISKRGG